MLKLMMMGCLTTLLGGLVVGGACVWVGKETVGASQRAFATAERSRAELDKKYAFKTPARREETEDSLDDFMDVRKELHKALKNQKHPKLDVTDVNTLMAPAQSLNTVLDFHFKNRVELVMKTLDSEEMSPAEYIWHLQTIYGAIVAGAAAGDADAKLLNEEIEKALPEGAGWLKPYLEEGTTKLAGTGEKSLATIKLLQQRKKDFLEGEMLWHDLIMLSVLGGAGVTAK
ncbi:MAG: hypothetical protein AB2A00_10400 [Myxococcota bacterium]